MPKIVPPTLGAESFNCPHCGAYAAQTWFKILPKSYDRKQGPQCFVAADVENFNPDKIKDDIERKRIVEFLERLDKHDVTYERTHHSQDSIWELHNVFASMCYSCGGWAVWVKKNIVYPQTNTEVERHEDLPDTLRDDFDEAASIVDLSPRGATALLRLCIQKLMPVLKEKGKDLNEDIASLVRKGLDVDVQRALDVVRVIGNNAVHPGQIDLKDDKVTALKLFDLLNLIVERTISAPKKLEAIFKGLPPTALAAIEKRDGLAEDVPPEGQK
jgi:Domain of unknown function (DUF4145)